MGKKKSKYEAYQSQDVLSNPKNRKVQEQQQIGRSQIGEKTSMTSRIVLVTILAVGVFFLSWLLLSIGQAMLYGFQGTVNNSIKTYGSPASQAAYVMPERNSGVRMQKLGSFVMLSADVAPEAMTPTAEEFWSLVRCDEHDEITYAEFVKLFFTTTADGGGFEGRYNGLRYNRLQLWDIWSDVTYNWHWPCYESLFDANAESVTAYQARDAADGRPEFVSMFAGTPGGDQAQGWVDLDNQPGDSNPGVTQGDGDAYATNPSVTNPGNQGTDLDPNGAGVATLPGGSTVQPSVPGSDGNNSDASHGYDFAYYLLKFSFGKFFFSLMLAAVVWGIAYVRARKSWEAQNALIDTTELNQYANDQHIQFPEEMMRGYEWFPDVGAHSPVEVSSMLGHVMLTNKGLKSVRVARRVEKDIVNADGEVECLKGEVLLDADGNPVYDTKPMIDEKFADALYDSAKVLNDKSIRLRYDTTDIPYNPGDKDRDRLPGAEHVSDMINKYWYFPDYEPQRPAGAYLVDTAPSNTMVLAITRAGKGQTYIEPTLDMWTREKRPSNMVINDPKGELLVKFFVKGTVRGYQIVQFNLINPLKTDIYNRAPRFVVKSYDAVCSAN